MITPETLAMLMAVAREHAARWGSRTFVKGHELPPRMAARYGFRWVYAWGCPRSCPCGRTLP